MAVGKIYTNTKTSKPKPRKPKPIQHSIKQFFDNPYAAKKNVKMTGTSAKGRNIAR